LKNLLLIGAAAAALLASPVMAQDTSAASGYLGLGWSQVDVDGLGEGDGWDLNGAVAFPVSQSLTMQLDASYLSADGDADAMFGQAHLFNRSATGSFGGFVAVADVEDVNVWGLGLEGAHYMENVTLAGVVAYGQVDDLDVDAWGIAGEARFFVSDNFRIDTTAGWGDSDGGDGWNLGIGGEMGLGETPFSLYAGYDHSDSEGLEADTLTIGLRMNFGTGSLKERDRSGASRMGARSVFGALF